MRFVIQLLAVVAAAQPGLALAARSDFARANPSDLNPEALRLLEQAIAHGDYPNTTSALIVRNGTRMAYKLRGTSIQTVDMLEKYILAALPCAKT